MNYFICKKCHRRLSTYLLSEYSEDFYPFCQKCEDANIIQIPLQIMLEKYKGEEEKKKIVRYAYNKLSRFHKRKSKDIEHLFVKYVLNKIKKTDTVLDIGCGWGWFSALLTEKTKERVESLDVSDIRINFCKKAYKDKSINFQQGFAEDLPFNDSYFDTAIMFDVLEHCICPEKVLKEVYRILKQNKKLFLIVPQLFGQIRVNLISNYRKTGRLFQLKRYLKYFCGLGLEGNLHLHEFTPRAIKKILKQNNFEFKVLTFRNYNRLPWYKKVALKLSFPVNYYSHTLFIEATKYGSG